jgi:hypothetical protein
LEAFITPESWGVEAGVSRARVGLEAKGISAMLYKIRSSVMTVYILSHHGFVGWLREREVG